MNRVILDQKFFEGPSVVVAEQLIGKYLVRRFDEREVALMISEVEAYEGPEDLASHARFGKTKRNEAMFGPAGHFYLYFIYGMYWMLNIVTEEVGKPSAVLIRGTCEVEGPGRLTKHLQLDRAYNGLKAEPQTGLWIEERGTLVTDIRRSPRIGVGYAQEWALKPYRFVLH